MSMADKINVKYFICGIGYAMLMHVLNVHLRAKLSNVCTNIRAKSDMLHDGVYNSGLPSKH